MFSSGEPSGRLFHVAEIDGDDALVGDEGLAVVRRFLDVLADIREDLELDQGLAIARGSGNGVVTVHGMFSGTYCVLLMWWRKV
ncbi:MAG: hypothetical protein ABIO72_03605 [Patescibacteria group bacterium]